MSIGIKDQCFGVEVEMTGITREQAANRLAQYFETTARHIGVGYDAWSVRDNEGKEWKLMRDGSIRTEKKSALVNMSRPEAMNTRWRW